MMPSRVNHRGSIFISVHITELKALWQQLSESVRGSAGGNIVGLRESPEAIVTESHTLL